MNLSLKNREWKEFFIEDIAEIVSGVDINEADRAKGNTPYITATANNNGVGDFIGNDNKSSEKKCISVNRTGSVGYAFYHPYNALYSNNCRKIVIKNKNILIGRFIASQISKQKDKYSYGYILGTERLKRQKILLPTNSQGEPDYEFMEAYIRQKEQEKINAHKNCISERISELENVKDVVPLSEKDWREFFLIDIFSEIQRGKRFKKDYHIKGKMPYVSSTAMNNGVDGYVENNNNVRIFSNCLSLANSGSVGACFYQSFEFVASDHITKLDNKDFKKSIYLFISTIVSRLGEKYSFNREINDTRIKREKILLPINENKEPDYDYMENYMKILELNKLKKYIEYQE